MSKFCIRNNTDIESFKSGKINIPSHLIGLKEVPLNHFLKVTKRYNVLSLKSGEEKLTGHSL